VVSLADPAAGDGTPLRCQGSHSGLGQWEPRVRSGSAPSPRLCLGRRPMAHHKRGRSPPTAMARHPGRETVVRCGADGAGSDRALAWSF
jgi:hypothetical protein